MRLFSALYLYLWLQVGVAAIISPWGESTLKVFNILGQNASGLDLIVEGDTSYLAAAYQGLYILDTSNIDDIKVKYHITLADFGIDAFSLYSLVKQGDYLYCGFRDSSDPYHEQGYLKVINLSNLDNIGPVIEPNDILFDGISNRRGKITGLFLTENTNELYAALRLGGLALIDISDPQIPLVKGIFDPGTIEFQQVVVDTVHKRAYYGSWSRGIGAVDITDADPANWTDLRVDNETESDRYWYLVQRGHYLYAPVADSPSDNSFDEGLAVYDLTSNFSDSSKPPERIGYAEIPPQFQCESAIGGKDEGLVGGDPGPHQIVLKDNYAIVANGCMGVLIFDITYPDKPLFIKAYEIPGQTDWPWSIAISGDSLITVGRNKNYTVNNDVYVFKIDPVIVEFDEQHDVKLDTLIYSETVTISGLGVPATISVTDGMYSINNGPFINSNGTIENGDTIQVLLKSSHNYSSKTSAILTVGGVSLDFSITTRPDNASSGSIGFLTLIALIIIRLLNRVFKII
ncbi:MAG: hypothetical protein OEY89_01995 [Gammaproteobacteria bacterium]|nr:hypothetical protein [Gammaproteobacteria bacterium]